MSALYSFERWFHAKVLRHPQYTQTSMQWVPVHVVCWCGVDWRMQ
jgi:hypothetical protein